MVEQETIQWEGQTGRRYRYWIYYIGTSFKKVPGNYIFAKQNVPLPDFSPIYIGETEDLSERFENHPKMPCIKRNGATHIHVHINRDGKTFRKAEEGDLIERWNSPCNLE